jgi:hypothetical protein
MIHAHLKATFLFVAYLSDCILFIPDLKLPQFHVRSDNPGVKQKVLSVSGQVLCYQVRPKCIRRRTAGAGKMPADNDDIEIDFPYGRNNILPFFIARRNEDRSTIP